MGKSIAKGLIAIGLGLFVASIGTGEDFYPRLSFGIDAIGGGFPIASVVLGTLIMGEVLNAMIEARQQSQSQGKITQIALKGSGKLTLYERGRLLPYILPSAFIGTAIGALPGIGSTLAATLGYTNGKKRHQRVKEQTEPDFGEGAIQELRPLSRAFGRFRRQSDTCSFTWHSGNAAPAIFLILAMETVDGLNPGPSVRLPSEGVNSEMVMALAYLHS